MATKLSSRKWLSRSHYAQRQCNVAVLELLQDISGGGEPFGFTKNDYRERAKLAFDRGRECLAFAQIHQSGQRTVWCAQHHPITLEPVAAWKKEPASLSGSESFELIKFLLRRGPINSQTIGMIEPALAWFKQNQLTGLCKVKNELGKTVYISDVSSTEIYWARFYDISIGRPIFAGGQDGIIYASFGEIAAKIKVVYDYFTTKPRELSDKEIERWNRRRQAK